MKYSIREGFRIPDDQAQRLGRAWEKLERSLNRPPTPQDVVDAARDPRSPFHPMFEWDDREAAIQYRLEQARYLLRALQVTLPEYGDAVVRAIIPTAPGADGFVSTRTAMREGGELVRQQVRRCAVEARRIAEEYAGWVALEGFAPARPFVAEAAKLGQEPI